MFIGMTPEPERPRVLQIHNPYRELGGEDSVVATEAELLRSVGCEVLTWRVPNPTTSLASVAALALAPWNPITARRTREVIASWQPEVVHLHNSWFALSPSVVDAVAGEGVPLVMSLHNYRLECVNSQFFRGGRACTDCHGTHPWRGVLHRCYRGSAPLSSVAAATIALNRRRDTWRGVSLFVAGSRFLARMAAQSGIDSSRIVEHPNVVADPGPRALPPSASDTILFVGRLSPEKGLEIALRAWKELGNRYPGRLVILGEGSEGALADEDWGPRVEFVGRRSNAEILAEMRSARALLFPSQWFECFPRVITEAFAAGLPVLASGIGAHGESVAELGSGWTIPAGQDVGPWVEALERLSRDPEEVDRAGEAARRAFERQLNEAAGAKRLLAIYERARSTSGKERQCRRG
jgi:glycosyltransferase involved in cell wall biosynthesis